MWKFILIAVVVILVTIGLVKLVDKFIPSKFKPFLTIALWILIGFLGYQTFMSVYAPIQFNKVKTKRYQKVIESLKTIREAQLAHRQVTGKFSDNFDKLITFVDTAEYIITQRRDTSVKDIAQSKLFGIDIPKDSVIVDTLGFVSVKDSLFKNSNRYKTMMNVPAGEDGAKFELKAGFLEQNESKIAVFEASVKKAIVLFDQDKNLVNQENQVLSQVIGVQGDAVRVGSMDDVDTGGNWAKLYDTKKE